MTTETIARASQRQIFMVCQDGCRITLKSTRLRDARDVDPDVLAAAAVSNCFVCGAPAPTKPVTVVQP